MNRKLFLAWPIVFIAWMAGSFVVHGTLLYDEYAQLPNLFRPETESQQLFPLMILAHVLLAGALVWIYSRGVERTPWLPQGLRFGLAVAFLTVIPTYIIYYVVQPMPSGMVVKQILFDAVLVVVLGAITAFLVREPAPRTV
ncbi:MAG TPA: hypothetical protein VFM14_12565 [Gemmatimonadales bacterium]|nr:hypothetical protein [Gemmatimonadales bacterium]